MYLRHLPKLLQAPPNVFPVEYLVLLEQRGIDPHKEVEVHPVRSSHRFILQAIDPVLGCPVLEAMLRVADLDRLRSLLGDAAADDAELRGNYEIDPVQLQAIADMFGVAFDSGGRECWLSRAHSIRDVPYLVHTGYELALMLDGRKPFAKFIVEYPVQPDDYSEEALFEPHVQSGLLIKRIMDDEPFEKPIRSPSGRIYDGLRRIYGRFPRSRK
jgi:hypothetical protein